MDISENKKSISKNGFLSVVNIYASYHKKEILRGISIHVSDGEIVTLIGPNGAGKSTLLKVIIGTLTPREGSVHFLNEDVTNLSPHLRVKKGISYFIQGGEIFSNLTILENLEMGGFNLPNHIVKERMGEVFELFPHLSEMEDKRAGLLSGGERQSLALGIILMKHPKLLLLDEPSAGLAPSLVKQMLAKIQQIKNNLKISIILVEQNVGESLSISDRTYLLKNGKVINEGNPEDITKNGFFDEVFFGKM